MIEEAKRYTVASLFCGLGGLDLGFQWEGYDILWANDNSAHAVKTHQLNFGIEAVCADLMQLPLSAIPDVDVIIGGPPCQSFSLIGRRLIDDPRGSLVHRFLEIVAHKRPRAFVMENVPGMAASRIDSRRLPDVLEESFAALGYHVTRLNLIAADYLVPQLRKRLVLVGCLNSPVKAVSKQAFARERYGLDLATYEVSARAAIGDLGPCTTKGKRTGYCSEEPSAFARIMRQKKMPDVSLHEMPRMSNTDRLLVSHIPPGGNYMDIPDDIAPGRVLKFKRTGGRTTTYGRLNPDKPAYTINTYFRRPNVGCNFHYSEPRLITPREAMRFQSIPDHFELSFGSQDQRNSLIGNAVPPLMAHAIAWELRKALSDGENRDKATYLPQRSVQLTLL